MSLLEPSNGSLHGHEETEPSGHAATDEDVPPTTTAEMKEELGKVWTGAPPGLGVSLFGSSAPRTPSPAPNSNTALHPPASDNNPPPSATDTEAAADDPVEPPLADTEDPLPQDEAKITSPSPERDAADEPVQDQSAEKGEEEAIDEDEEEAPPSLGQDDSEISFVVHSEKSAPEDSTLSTPSNNVPADADSAEERKGEETDLHEQEKPAENQDEETELKDEPNSAPAQEEKVEEKKEEQRTEEEEDEEDDEETVKESAQALKDPDQIPENSNTGMEEMDVDSEASPKDNKLLLAEPTDAAEEKDADEPEGKEEEAEESAKKEEAQEEAESMETESGPKEEEEEAAEETPTRTPGRRSKKMSKREAALKAAAARKAKRLAAADASAADDQESDVDAADASAAPEDATQPMDATQEGEEVPEAAEKEAQAEEATPRRRSSRREKAQEETATSAQKTPARRTTRRASAATPAAPTPTAKTPKAVATPRSSGKRKREATPTEEATEEAEEEKTEAGSQRRSGRRRHLRSEDAESGSNRSSATPQPTTPAVGRPKRGAKAAAAAAPATLPRRTRGSPAPAKATAAAPATAPRTGPAAKRAKRSGGSKDSADPFDFERQADESPEPLKNINTSRGAHGAVTFTTTNVTPKAGASKFSFTESAAAMRVSGTAGTPGLRQPLQLKSGAGSVKKETKASASKRTPAKAALFTDMDDDGSADAEDEEEEAAAASAPTPGRRGRRSKADSAASTPRSGRRAGSESLEATPKSTPGRKSATVPRLTPEEQLAADHPDDVKVSHLNPGGRVLAKWPGDKCFYAAWVLESSGFGAYRVKYWDGAVRQCPAPDLVPLASITPSKVLMRMVEGEDELHPIRIEAAPSHTDAKEWYAGIFSVFNETTEKEEKVHWEKMMIEKEQGKDFVSTDAFKLAQEVTAENISSSKKRESRRRAEEAIVEELAPTTPLARKTSRGPATPKSAGRNKAPAARAVDVEEATASTDTKRFFSGLHFVLTSANRRPKGEEEAQAQPAFNKKAVRVTIEERGGTVVEDFSTTSEPVDNLFLVADTHYRTHKYLSALARAVPCVNHCWILDSVKQEKLLDYKTYMLPAGVSLERNQVMEWHDECPGLLADCDVLVHTENRPSLPTALDFVQIWSPLVKCMGARLLRSIDSGDKVDVLLTDSSCAAGTLEAAKKKGAVAVSSEWLIQAIITGERPDPDAHPKYHYAYVEQLASPK